MHNRFLKTIVCVFAASVVWLSGFSAFAQDGSYDQYTALPRYSASGDSWKNYLNHIFVYPFELVRWPLNQSLVTTEKYRLDKKTKWIYEQVVDQGITPRASVLSIGSFGAGFDVDWIRLARQKENLPDFQTKSWLHWHNDVTFEVGSKIGMERIAETGAKAGGLFKYEKRPEDHFYGIGPDTSKGDGTSYKNETTTLEALAGYSLTPDMSVDFKFAWQNINITEGEDDGRGQIDPIFFPQTIPGLDGDDLVTLGTEWDHDTRNLKTNSTKGGEERLAFSYNEGVGNSDARYFKYVAELSRYISLWSKRRVLAFHVYGEHNNETNNHEVPFHQMARLGGYGSYPRISKTLRSYDNNRFFDENMTLLNMEYRYTVWEYREFKLDAVFFFDEGQVFGEFGEFQFQDFRESYGIGGRLSLANHILLSIELAHGDEGTEFHVKSATPF